MSIFVTGDTHGTLDIGKLPKFFDGKQYTKNDYLIICGDVGICGFSESNEQETRRILRNLPVTVLWIDGNHENFDKLEEYPIEKWNGGKVQFIEDDMIHLMRGQVYTIDGFKFFTFGGAYSIDKYSRTEGISWFSQELPSKEEYEEGLVNLEKNDFSLDYIITHTGPYKAVRELVFADRIEDRQLRKYLQMIADDSGFSGWYFGHYHVDVEIDDRMRCIYNDIIEIE